MKNEMLSSASIITFTRTYLKCLLCTRLKYEDGYCLSISFQSSHLLSSAKHAAYFFKTSESSSGVEKARNFSLHHSADIQLSFALTGQLHFGSYLEIDLPLVLWVEKATNCTCCPRFAIAQLDSKSGNPCKISFCFPHNTTLLPLIDVAFITLPKRGFLRRSNSIQCCCRQKMGLCLCNSLFVYL